MAPRPAADPVSRADERAALVPGSEPPASSPCASAPEGPPARPWRRLALLRTRGSAAVGVAFATGATATGVRRMWFRPDWHAMGEKPPLKPFKLYDASLPMPNMHNQYDGIQDNRPLNVQVNEWGEVHAFVLGDWGAPLKYNNGRPPHKTAGSKPGEDEDAQFWVAGQMKARAAWAKPQYVLNAGDNFYWGGIEGHCTQGPGAAWGEANHEFDEGWRWIYGPLTDIPWISTLGNHDYGGYMMTAAWPTQIGYSFVNHNWILPARYYTRKMWHGDYDVEYFVIDSNANDAFDPWLEPQDHNICSQNFNTQGGCGSQGGPENVWSCKDWFWASYKTQKAWLQKKVQESTSLWKVVVTHFPCGYDGSFYKDLHDKYGLNLVVSGHRHQQELWWSGTKAAYIQDFLNKNDIGDLTCVVSGGGGGIISEKFGSESYMNDLAWYGFFDLTFNKWFIKVELINSDGRTFGNRTIDPSPTQIIKINEIVSAQRAEAANQEAEQEVDAAAQLIKAAADSDSVATKAAPNEKAAPAAAGAAADAKEQSAA